MRKIKIKTDWQNYLHNLRFKEIQLIKKYLDQNYEKILEIGAGDGYQSQLLKDYCKELYCTELNEFRLKKSDPEINYLICDAENLEKYFSPNTFDLIFSSNLFEHLPNPELALRGIKKILKADGLSINIMPNPFFALSIILLHYPNLLITKFEKLVNRIISKEKNLVNRHSMENNIKVKRNNSWLRKLLILPKPHGISDSFFAEARRFSKRAWIKLIKKEGFEVEKIIKGPVYSGYGFGLKPITKFLEFFGITSEYIYILKIK